MKISTFLFSTQSLCSHLPFPPGEPKGTPVDLKNFCQQQPSNRTAGSAQEKRSMSRNLGRLWATVCFLFQAAQLRWTLLWPPYEVNDVPHHRWSSGSWGLEVEGFQLCRVERQRLWFDKIFFHAGRMNVRCLKNWWLVCCMSASFLLFWWTARISATLCVCVFLTMAFFPWFPWIRSWMIYSQAHSHLRNKRGMNDYLYTPMVRNLP